MELRLYETSLFPQNVRWGWGVVRKKLDEDQGRLEDEDGVEEIGRAGAQGGDEPCWMVPTCTPCPVCGKECGGHGDAVARGACHHGGCDCSEEGGAAGGHTWPTVWVKFRTRDSSTSTRGAGSGRVQDDVGARTAEGWRQFFAKSGGEEDKEVAVGDTTKEQGSRSGAVLLRV